MLRERVRERLAFDLPQIKEIRVENLGVRVLGLVKEHLRRLRSFQLSSWTAISYDSRMKASS